MQPSYIPQPDTIPAPWWLFEVLGVLTFALHILLINIVVGGLLLLFVQRLTGKANVPDTAMSASKNKLPTLLALAITIGIAPLLFVQVTYGHLFYASSIVMASWWMLIIPVLIVSYYMLYIHTNTKNGGLATLAALLGLAGFFYIGLMWTNNMTLMLEPQKWTAYFAQRDGWLLNMSDPTIWPRYLHFVFASIAIAGLAASVVWSFRKKTHPDVAAKNIAVGLSIFAYATIAQILDGFWWLMALPRETMLLFMGGNMAMTVLLMAGILLAIGALVVALLKKLAVTVAHLIAVMAVMSTMRALLRSAYLRDIFSQSSLQLKPQLDVLILFLLVLVLGLASVWWMIKAVRRSEPKGVAA